MNDDDQIKQAFFAGARAFFSEDDHVGLWQEVALPGVYDKWVEQGGLSRAHVSGAGGRRPAEQGGLAIENLCEWACPECGETGEGDSTKIPLYCFVCYSKPDAGKWVECVWDIEVEEAEGVAPQEPL